LGVGDGLKLLSATDFGDGVGVARLARGAVVAEGCAEVVGVRNGVGDAEVVGETNGEGVALGGGVTGNGVVSGGETTATADGAVAGAPREPPKK
jgi:hypothetical protein